LGYYAMPTSDHADARSSFSAPRATIFNASSGKRSLQRLRFVPRRAHPNVALFIRRQDHRHRLGMTRFGGGGWRPHEDARYSKKGPGFIGAFLLFTFFDDSLAARAVIVFLLDDSRAVCWLTFLDYGIALTNPVTVVVAALTNGHAGATWADANTYANFLRECGRGEGAYCSDNQCVFHRHLLFVLSTSANPAVWGKFPKSMQISGNFHTRRRPSRTHHDLKRAIR
jgi:hypothetical protein